MTTANDLIISTATAPITISLPDASTVKTYYFQNSGTSSVTIQTINSQTINGNSELIIQFLNSSVMLVADGSAFYIF